MRATDAQLKNPMTSTVMVRLGPVTETSAIATSRNGTHSTTSISRASTVSTMPPRNPAASPTHDADDDGERGRGHADDERDAGAVRDPDQDVPAEVVGAEPELWFGATGRPSGDSPVSRNCSFGPMAR